MIRAEKEEKVSVLRDTLESSKSIVLVDFRGVNVEMANLLRTEVKNSDVKYLVVKNTLLKKAIEKTRFEGLDRFLTGPTAIAFSEVDAVVTAKIIHDFSRRNEVLTIKGGFLENDVLEVRDVAELAELPSKDELIGKAVFVISSPLISLMNLLSNPIKNLIVVLKLLEKQKEKSNNGG